MNALSMLQFVQVLPDVILRAYVHDDLIDIGPNLAATAIHPSAAKRDILARKAIILSKDRVKALKQPSI
ncbi:MAG TPA: hypothetical protein VGU45_13580 [Microvirga sp.]|nr:hypothetical protein [Microvirga sp.]